MGFRRGNKVFNFKFQEGEYDGFEVKLKSLTLGEFATLLQLREDKLVEAGDDLFKMVGESLIGWNLETEDGEPIPANLEGLYTQDFSFLMFLMDEWMQAMSQVPVPLDRLPKGGGTSQELSGLMEAL
jgi:hypothetical protein